MKPRKAMLSVAAVTFMLAGCGEDSTSPEPTPPPEDVHHYTRTDLHPEGQVVETANGYTVQGALHVDNESGQTSFLNAALNVQFDNEGRLSSVSGSAQIPPPSDRVSFADPIQADVGFFTGKFLNDNRELPILLKDKLEYFIFYFAVAVEMRIRDDDSATEAALTISAPVGGQVLMVTDYTDPMYFVYGEQDLVGAAGNGTSWRGRLPYVPIRPAQDIYSFDGKSIRVGKFEVKQIFEIEGTIIEGTHAGIHLMFDPIDADLDAGYGYGINGAMNLSLPVKDVVEFGLPIAEGSAAIRGQASTSSGVFAGAFIDGVADAFQWWPNIIPIKPVATLSVQGLVETTGAFDLHLHGEYGLEAFESPQKLVGDFHLTPEALTLAGAVVTGDATYQLTGVVTGSETTIIAAPPQPLLERISSAVNTELEDSIAEAQQAWEDLQEATADYEFELSLRGLRAALLPAIDFAKREISRQINARLAEHQGRVYYDALRDFIYNADNKYYSALDNLRAQALATQDSDAWRAAIEAALRTAASYAWFDETFEYKILGQTVATVRIRIHILSDEQVAQINLAANNVRYIKETWEVKVRAQDIYDRIPDREIFERVRDDIRNGVVAIPSITEIGYVQPHLSPDIALFATIGGTRHDVGAADLFDLAEMSATLAAKVVSILVGG